MCEGSEVCHFVELQQAVTLLGHKDSGDYELQRRNHSVCFVVTDWGMSHVLTHLFCIIIFLSREP